ncbi:MAG: peptidylprolyl isomerase [Solirubrobacterales bacterium]
MGLTRPPAALALAFVLVAFALVACGDDEEEQTTAAASEDECAEVEVPAPKDARFDRPSETLARGERAAAVVETSCGTFEIELDTDGSPKTSNSFAFLAEEKFYDGTLFHRIAPGFVIQGGDPTGTGSGGPGYTVTEPPPGDTEYLKGTVAMAKTQVEPPGASGSQFFVVTAAADAGLPADFALLGEVGKGIDVVERIGELGDPATEQPTQAVVIEAVTIERG